MYLEISILLSLNFNIRIFKVQLINLQFQLMYIKIQLADFKFQS